MAKQVVLCTHSLDNNQLIADVMAAVRARGATPLRFDTDRFPIEVPVSILQDEQDSAITVGNGTERITIGAEDVIWYRRAYWGGKLPRTMDRQLLQVCIAESEATLRGLMASFPGFVLDPPERVRLCDHKLRQLRMAKELGMATPRTLVTNDPVAAQQFIASCPRGAVAKMLTGFAIYDDQQAGQPAERKDDNMKQERVVFTSSLTPELLKKLDGLRYCPMVFQEKIEKRLELRITVIGARMFAAAVDSQAMAGAEIDWRQKGAKLVESWTSYTLPKELEAQLGEYMARIGMQYSAIDVIVEPSGRHVFLEANPGGEFVWLESCSPHFPLVAALADALTDQPGARRVP